MTEKVSVGSLGCYSAYFNSRENTYSAIGTAQARVDSLSNLNEACGVNLGRLDAAGTKVLQHLNRLSAQAFKGLAREFA